MISKTHIKYNKNINNNIIDINIKHNMNINNININNINNL